MDFLLGGSLAALAVSSLAHAFSYLGDDLERNPSVTYAAFKQKAKTGDLILTSNTSLLTLSRVVTQSPWSHCGILYEDPETGTLYEWSAHNPLEEVVNTKGLKGFGGAQLVPLDFLASDYGGFFWRPLKKFGKEERAKLQAVIDALAYQVKFPDVMEFGAFLGGPFAKALNGSSGGLACSHLVALSYMAAGAMVNDRHITQFVPSSFDVEGDAKWLLPVSPHTYMVTGYDTSRLIRL
jgi:hypothetical protein